MAIAMIEAGWRWEKEPEGSLELKWSQEADVRDLSQGNDLNTRRRRTMTLAQEMANSLLPGISLTVDLPANYLNGKVPMLDT